MRARRVKRKGVRIFPHPPGRRSRQETQRPGVRKGATGYGMTVSGKSEKAAAGKPPTSPMTSGIVAR